MNWTNKLCMHQSYGPRVHSPKSWVRCRGRKAQCLYRERSWGGIRERRNTPDYPGISTAFWWCSYLTHPWRGIIPRRRYPSTQCAHNCARTMEKSNLCFKFLYIYICICACVYGIGMENHIPSGKYCTRETKVRRVCRILRYYVGSKRTPSRSAWTKIEKFQHTH